MGPRSPPRVTNPKQQAKVLVTQHVQLLVTPGTAGHQAPLTMGLSRQEYWCGFPFPSPGDLLDPGIKLRSPALQADPLTSEPPGQPQSLAWVSLNCLLIN